MKDEVVYLVMNDIQNEEKRYNQWKDWQMTKLDGEIVEKVGR